MEKAVATLKEEISKIVEDYNIVVLAVVHRSSESLYNYKTVKLYIIYKPKYPSHEETLVRNIEIITAYTGAYQEYSNLDVEDIVEELKKQYEVHEVEIY
jgi:hypothetical protein